MIVYAPVEGKLIDITEVNDPVFSKKMIGDGMAIIPTSNLICSPIEGIIESIFPTNHAFIVRSFTGTQILIHIGIDTVELKGKPFKRLLNTGAIVKTGDPIIRSDYKMISKNGFDNTVIVIADKTIQNKQKNGDIYSSKDIIFEVID